MTQPVRRGTQSIERAVLILREIATHGRFGWGLWDIAERCGLDRGTTHRILACLVREGLLQQRSQDRRYLPGPLLFELGLSTPAYADLQAAGQAPVDRIARHFGGLALLNFRSGADFVCVARAGESVYRGTAMEVGTRRPLVTSAGGVAILIALQADEARAIEAQNLRRLARLGEANLRALEKMIRRSQKLGFAFNRSETARGVHAFGVALRDARGEVFGSVALAGAAQAFPASRAAQVVAFLRAQAALIEDAARQLLPGGVYKADGARQGEIATFSTPSR